MPVADELGDQPVDLGLGADVDAARGLVEQQHPALAQQPAREHDLLLVAARELARDPVRVVRDGVELAQLVAGRALLAAAVDQQPAVVKRPRSESVTFLARLQPSSRPCDLRSSGARPDAAAAIADVRPAGRQPACRRRRPRRCRGGRARRSAAAARCARRRPGRRCRRPRPRGPRSCISLTTRRARDAAHVEHRRRRSRLGAGRDRAGRPCGRPSSPRARRCGVSAGRPVATVRPSESTVTRSPMRGISSRRCEM